ncbi:MAG: hypothetical protein BIFFINMI_02922 [Phycisphaerae bacterium]|nr:hypothetical protein [Phycisphaerae bacterium]
MSFTGKATYSGGATLPETAEDVADLVAIVSPFETPLLDHLGDPLRSAHSTVHEWLEDALLPNSDTIDQAVFTDPDVDDTFGVDNATRFRAGDQLAPEDSAERMLVTAVDAENGTITVTRGYGGSTPEDLSDGQSLRILGNAALEGGQADDPRFTVRQRKANYTQIFTRTVMASGSELAVRQIAVADELDYQKQERLRELLRDLENTVINGRSAAATPAGSADVRRTMSGMLSLISTNRFTPGQDGFPAGEAGVLDEEMLNAALRAIWDQSSGRVDTILVGGSQKRQINGFLSASRSVDSGETTYRDRVSVYESDFGVCRVVLSRWVPGDKVILLDSRKTAVLAMAGRSFHYKPLSATGDYEHGQLIGEYTLELRNENAHGVIDGLA